MEQKFLYGPGTEEKLLALGATLEGRSSFRDRYYDTPNWGLTLADHWLREREGAGWELKCPPQLLEDSSSGCATHLPTGSQRPRDLPHGLQPLEGGGRLGAATQYQEVTCAQAILTHVCGLLGVAPLAAWHNDMARAVSELGLEEFASFVTCRRRYRLGNLHVDLDAADFGYNVGEVEAVVGQLENVSEATAWIQALGSQLGEQHVWARRGLRAEQSGLPGLGS